MKHFILLILLSSVAFAQKNAAVPDPDPEIERKSFIVADGFEVTLFAADPLLAKPIQMNWDTKGRLWLATSEVYPQIKPGQTANDKILILEDTDGDGKADKTEVFADGLLIPTAVLPGDGGCYVANSTEIIHLSQSKPGIKADKRRVVLSGFGTEDTHHLIHTFRWGPDGAMYFNQSVYIHSHVETPHGTVRLNGGGIWRYEPRTQKLEVFARGFWNPWGLAFDKYGTLFATDGAGSGGIYHVVPGASYATGHNQSPRILPGLNPGSPKYCGLEIVSGRHFPDDWQGDLITNDFRGHRVCRFKLRDDGSTFESREMTEVIKSTHPAFRPIDVSIGPDGALYIADWYNPIIQHGEVDFRDPRRDKTHGRIWRVTAKGRPLDKKPTLTTLKIDALWQQLAAPDSWTRSMAKRLLIEYYCNKSRDEAQGDFLRPEVQLIEGGHYHAMFEALLINVGIDPQNCHNLLQMKFKDQRYWHGALVRWPSSVKNVEYLVESAFKESDPKVRLAALRGIQLYFSQYGDTLTASGASLTSHVLNVMNHPLDPTLEYALRLTLQELQDYWLPAFKEGKFDYGNDMKKLAFALEAVQSPETIKPLVALIKAGKIPDANLADAWVLVAKLGTAEDIEQALLYATTPSAGERGRDILDAIITSAQARKIKPNELTILKVLNSPNHFGNPNSIPQRCKLVGLWKIESERAKLEGLVQFPGALPPGEDKAQALAHAKAALEGIALLGGKPSMDYLAWIAGEHVPPPMNEQGRLSMGEPDRQTQRDAVIFLIPLDAGRAAKAAVMQLGKSTPHAVELVNAFIQQKNGPAILAKELEKTTMPGDVAKLVLRAVKNAGNPSPALIAAITKAGKLTETKVEIKPDDVKRLTADATAKGDAARGEAVFRRRDLQCFNCHAIGGAGGQVGPDLTSIGASAQTDYLVESLLLPNKAIKEGYHTVDVTTLAGKIYSGIKLREAGGELVLRDKDNKEITLKLEEIDTRRQGRSLMPDGTTESLTTAEFVDLVKFLSELGKQGPYAPVTAKVVRSWEAVEPTKENLNLFRRERVAVAAEKPEAVVWSALYSNVNGTLKMNDLPKFVVWKENGEQSAVRTKFTVSTAGTLSFKPLKRDGLTIYLDGKPVESLEGLDVKTGEHALVIVIDRSKAANELRLEVDDKSTARVSLTAAK